MDGNLREYYGATSGIKLNYEAVNLIGKLRIDDKIVEQNSASRSSVQSELHSNVSDPLSAGDSNVDYDFIDMVLKYINEILMEEEMEDKVCVFQGSAALEAAEKSFYDVLGEKYPPPDRQVPNLNRRVSSRNENYLGDYDRFIRSNGLRCPNWNCDASESNSIPAQHFSVDIPSLSTSRSSYVSSSSSGADADRPVDSPDSILRISNTFSDNQSATQFKKGVEEASKFLPDGNALLVAFHESKLLGKDHNGQSKPVQVEKHENGYSPDESRGKKNHLHEDLHLQGGRSNKQQAVFTESIVRSDLFDKVLLCGRDKGESDFHKALQDAASKNIRRSNQPKGSNGGKSCRKKKGNKRNVVDLRSLLTLCAQAVAANDQRTANEFLKQIRQHSSPNGDGMQRLATYFADGLEARLAGSGTQIYKALISLPTSAVDLLKAYQLFLVACPFRKISIFFSNKTIIDAAEKASTLHIIDFGILYGFQWPCLIQALSSRPGGPPKLRITGIDLPQPGFRPAQRVEETGRRLANYAETFKVPFEFNAIAQKWDTIRIEDLKIHKDDMLAVNCLYRFRNLLDETVVVNSPRNIVLNLISKMKPDVFIMGIVNGAYNAPFFITRFREALFHYSSLFDMLEANIPREIHERMLLEKTILGREAMNVIACEAAERVERPETYKQWQVRNIRAGFRQLPHNKEIMRRAKEWVKSHHKDFMIDEDSQWLLQGWKGRILYALSSWRPAE